MKIDGYWDLAFFAFVLIFALGMASLGAKKTPSLLGFNTTTPTPFRSPTIPPGAPTVTGGPSPTNNPLISSTPTPSPINSPTATPLPGPTITGSPLSTGSKLGVFVLDNWSSGTDTITNSGSRIVIILDPSSSEMSKLKLFKQKYPNAIAVARFYHQQGTLQANVTDDPIVYANTYFNTIDGSRLTALGTDRNLFNYVTGPNEFEDLPYPWPMPGDTATNNSTTRSQWNAKFWLKLAQLYSTNFGLKACIFSVQPGAGHIDSSVLSNMLTQLEQIRQLGGAICYHGYTSDYSTDISNSNPALWYRNYYTYFNSSAPNLSTMPLIVGEVGYAATSSNGYLSDTSDPTHIKYENWLSWYDNQLRNDSYVLGGTIFQIGSGNWGSFNVESISGWLGNYISTH